MKRYALTYGNEIYDLQLKNAWGENMYQLSQHNDSYQIEKTGKMQRPIVKLFSDDLIQLKKIQKGIV